MGESLWKIMRRKREEKGRRCLGAGVVAQQVKPLLTMLLASHIGEPVSVPATMPPIQLPANAPGKAMEVGPRTWAPVPT